MVSYEFLWIRLCLRCFFISPFRYSGIYKEQTEAFLCLTIKLQSLCVTWIRASQMTWTVSNCGAVVGKIRTRSLSLCRVLLARFPASTCLPGVPAIFVLPSRILQASQVLVGVADDNREGS